MRTTLVINDGLVREAKRVAVETGRTLSGIVEDALRAMLARRHSATARRVRLPVSRHAGKVGPGVNLDDTSALLDLMETGKTVSARR